MSSPGSLSGISFGGLSSGIDTETIISRLIQVESIPMQRLQRSQQEIQQKQSVYGQFRSKVSSLASAASSLNSSTAFTPVSASSSTPATATIVGTTGASAGTYQLSVTALAKNQKIASSARTDTTTALGSAGNFVINGKSVAVTTNDNLTTIASKINSLQVGVTASLIDGGTGNAYITLASNTTGAANKIQLSDATGSVLSSLGILSGAANVREAITNGATSQAYSSSSTVLNTQLGGNGPAAGNIVINGTSVAIDTSTDTLQGVANKINAAGITGVGASVRSITNGGTTTYKLDITGSTTPTFGDPDQILGSLGVLQKGAGNELSAAQDAAYSLDGVNLTSSTNVISSVIPGATLTLLQGNTTTSGVTSPSTSTLTVSRDSGAIKGKIKAVVNAYNDMSDFIKSASSFDSKTFETGPLFGDSMVRQVQDTISTTLFNNVPGVTGKYNNLANIGFSLDKDGVLNVDESVLDAAIASAPDAVQALFQAGGSSVNKDLTYVSSTSATKASGGTGYSVNVTQLATKQSFIAGLAGTAPASASEKLTFNGALLNSSPYSIDLDFGASLSATVAKLNNDSRLKNLITASIDGGKLRIDSNRFGAIGNFTVTSNLTAGTDNSGIGDATTATIVGGLNVAGTINGENATGSGQFLTGDTGNANTAGLQIQVGGTTTGSLGNVVFSKGIGSLTNDFLTGITDTVNGILSVTDKSLQSQIDQLSTDITDFNTRLVSRQQELKQKFARMEEAINAARSQSTSLSSFAASR